MFRAPAIFPWNLQIRTWNPLWRRDCTKINFYKIWNFLLDLRFQNPQHPANSRNPPGTSNNPKTDKNNTKQ